MAERRYILASNKAKKLDCPYCGAKKHWQRYIDIETGEVLPEKHGRCDNSDKCGQWVTPKDTGYAKIIWEQEQGNCLEPSNNWKTQLKMAIPRPTTDPVFFDFETFRQTLQPDCYEKNTFLQNLFYRVQFPFEVEDVTKVIQFYRLGTVAQGYRAGANTFPFIDLRGNVRAIQVKQFDESNHTTGTDFLHSIIEKHHARNNMPLPGWLEAYMKQDKIISCLFGEHLLSKFPDNPVALVEAPKTAVYGALYFGLPETPESIIWLAVYNKSSFSFEKLKVLQGRLVYVFPDLSKDGNTFKEWESKANEYENRLPGTRFVFSDLLEQLAPEIDKSEGNDLADYLIKQDWRLFRPKSQPVFMAISSEPVRDNAQEPACNIQNEKPEETFLPDPMPGIYKMKELPIEFIGTGEVRGYYFTQLECNDLAYLYEVSNPETGSKHYEVFIRKINRRFMCASYPKQNSFGIWAWCIRDEKRARDLYKLHSNQIKLS